MINYSIDLVRHVIFYEYRDIAINSAEDLSDNKIGDKKNLLTNFIFLKIVINKIYTMLVMQIHNNLILHQQCSKKKRILCHIYDIELLTFRQSTVT